MPPMRVWTTELGEHVGERVTLQGWLLNHRPLARVDFVILRDGKGVCQIVATDEAVRAEVAQWHDETVFVVEGTPKPTRRRPAGSNWWIRRSLCCRPRPSRRRSTCVSRS